MQLEEILQKAGLNKQEIKIYLAGLEGGPNLAYRLSRKTGFSRTNTYNILKSLEEKGLVSKSSKGYNTFFTMESPTRLKNQLERKKEETEILERELEKILPSIKFTQPPFETAPKIRVFEGKEAIKNIIEDTIKEPIGEILAIIGGRDFEKIVGVEFLKHFVQKRVAKNIQNRTLRKPTILKDFPLETNKAELRETRYLPPRIDVKTTTIVYDNSIAIISSEKEDFGFVVESKELAHFFKIFFETFWEVSKKPK